MHGDTILASHLTYGAIDTNAAAAFIVAGTPVGRVKREDAAAAPEVSADGGDLFSAAMDVPDSSLTPDADTPQRVPSQTGPPPTADQFKAVSPPATAVPAPAAPPATDASPVPAAPLASPPAVAPMGATMKDKREPGGHGYGGYAGPQDVPNAFNLPNLPAALSPVKRTPGGYHGGYAGPQDLPDAFNLPNLPAALSPVKE